MFNDTICALSTAHGTAAISVVRVSGNEAIKKVNNIFIGKDLTKVKSHTANYGHILDIDEVIVFVYHNPKSFTKEDVVEINCHGGVYVTKLVIRALFNEGIRLAEKGEFTKRAFLNGRIDLVKAESIMDVINAKTNKSLKIAHQANRQSIMINDLKNEVLKIIANIEVNIDYPEYEDAYVVTKEILIPRINNLLDKINIILKKSENGRLIKEGIKTAIIGRPNVGKSSILNALLQEEKAIVTNIPGTTRDLVEGYITLEGITLNLLDTAGLRKTNNKVEKIGVSKTLETIKTSELLMIILDNSQALAKEDKEVLEKTKNKKRIVIINKGDLNSKLKFKGDIIISASNKIGLDKLEELIINKVGLSDFNEEQDDYLANERQIALLTKAKKALDEALNAATIGLEIDMIEIDLKNAFLSLGDILGETNKDTIIDELFSRFCLGK